MFRTEGSAAQGISDLMFYTESYILISIHVFYKVFSCEITRLQELLPYTCKSITVSSLIITKVLSLLEKHQISPV